ncbi:hypothetical protein C8Q73DRAFT_652493 [Cubamyces lactineus]|nr:hypothetical protein C8Q73DRAFT_792862 [Cubamyces lactineus]KAH9890425.1 hypothetical protein C8Q73DRAFT_652493 [Cubamyces lactineus]
MPRASHLRDAMGEGYATRAGRERGTLRAVLSDGLVAFTGDPRATMRWTVDRFCNDVFLRYPAKLVGWPPRIPFANLSSLSMPTSTVNTLLRLWEKGILRWEAPTSDELAAAKEDAKNAAPSPLIPDRTVRCGRNDIGKRRKRPTVDSVRFPPRYTRDGPKSLRRTEDESEDEIEDEVSVRASGRAGQCSSASLDSMSRYDNDEIEDADSVWGTSSRRRPLSGMLEEDPIDYFTD